MYSTKADILESLSEAELIDLTDDADLGVVDDAVVDRAIADADAEIDAYCGSRHQVPFAAVPAMIRKVSVDIAIYNLYARRRGAPADRKERYDNAIRFLRGVADGTVSLGVGDPDGTPSGSEAPSMSQDNPARVFGRANLEFF